MQEQHILAMPELGTAIINYLKDVRKVTLPDNADMSLDQKAVGIGGAQVIVATFTPKAPAGKKRGRKPKAQKAAQVAAAEKAAATKARGRKPRGQ
jgi:hypothetical protein